MNTLVQLNKITPSDGAADDSFGSFIASSASGNLYVVGSTGDDFNGSNNQGSAYVLRRNSNGALVRTQQLVASDQGDGDLFGTSAAVFEADDGIVVSAPGHDNSKGAVYVYTFNSNTGMFEDFDKLVADDAADNDMFGSSLSYAAETIVVGAKGNDDTASNSGSAYIFRLGAGGFSSVKKLVATDPAMDDEFGTSVAITSIGRIAIGSPLKDESDTNSGGVYIFDVDSNCEYNFFEKLSPGDVVAETRFGSSVAFSPSGNLAVGASGSNEIETGGGKVDIYTSSGVGNSFAQPQAVTPNDIHASDGFGKNPIVFSGESFASSVEVRDGTDPAGNPISQAGAVYVFEKDNSGNYQQAHKLVATDASNGLKLGHSLAFANGVVVAGSIMATNENGVSTGAVYEFGPPLPTTSPSLSISPSVSPSTSPSLSLSPFSSPVSGCFSADTTVEVLGRGQVMMKDLNVGDQVRSKSGFSTIYSFGYFSPKDKLSFVKITTNSLSSNMEPIFVSANHIVFVGIDKIPKLVKDVNIGDMLTMIPSQDLVQVTMMENIIKTGVFQPLTHDGTVVVNGLLASVYSVEKKVPMFSILDGYSPLVDMHEFQHGLFTPLRILCQHSSSSDEGSLCFGNRSQDEFGSHHWDSVVESFVNFLSFSTSKKGISPTTMMELDEVNFFNISSTSPPLMMMMMMAAAAVVFYVGCWKFSRCCRGEKQQQK